MRSGSISELNELDLLTLFSFTTAVEGKIRVKHVVQKEQFVNAFLKIPVTRSY